MTPLLSGSYYYTPGCSSCCCSLSPVRERPAEDSAVARARAEYLAGDPLWDSGSDAQNKRQRRDYDGRSDNSYVAPIRAPGEVPLWRQAWPLAASFPPPSPVDDHASAAVDPVAQMAADPWALLDPHSNAQVVVPPAARAVPVPVVREDILIPRARLPPVAAGLAASGIQAPPVRGGAVAGPGLAVAPPAFVPVPPAPIRPRLVMPTLQVPGAAVARVGDLEDPKNPRGCAVVSQRASLTSRGPSRVDSAIGCGSSASGMAVGATVASANYVHASSAAPAVGRGGRGEPPSRSGPTDDEVHITGIKILELRTSKTSPITVTPSMVCSPVVPC